MIGADQMFPATKSSRLPRHDAPYCSLDDSFKPTSENVAVVGCGGIGVQIMPAIQPIVKSIDHYLRGKIWVLPPGGRNATPEPNERGPNNNCKPSFFIWAPLGRWLMIWIVDHSLEERNKFCNDSATYLAYDKKIETYINCVQATAMSSSHGLALRCLDIKHGRIRVSKNLNISLGRQRKSLLHIWAMASPRQNSTAVVQQGYRLWGHEQGFLCAQCALRGSGRGDAAAYSAKWGAWVQKVKSSLIEGAKWKMVCIRRRSDWQYDSLKCCGECRVCSEPVKNSVISNGGVAENDNSHTRRGGCVSA